MLWCCACSRILTTSMGVTTATASVTPAASPARRSDENLKYRKGEGQSYQRTWLVR